MNMSNSKNITIIIVLLSLITLFSSTPLKAEQQQGILTCDMVTNYKDLISAHPGSLKCILNKDKATIGDITLNHGNCEPTRTINIPKKAGETLFLEFTCDLTEAEIEVDGSKYRYSFPINTSAQASNVGDPTRKIFNAIKNMGIGQ